MPDGYESGVPCWVETWQADAEAAARFYTGLFGWDTERVEAPASTYFMCRLDGRDVAGIGSSESLSGPAAWTTSVWVESVEEDGLTGRRDRRPGGARAVRAWMGDGWPSWPIPRAPSWGPGVQGSTAAPSSSTNRARGHGASSRPAISTGPWPLRRRVRLGDPDLRRGRR